MSDTTINLGLPYIMAAQAQKHVTHNEALRALDTIVQLTVEDRDLSAPPASPVEGQCFIVAAGATGAWAGQEGLVAAYQDAAWLFYPVRTGWRAWIVDESALFVWNGSSWQQASVASLNPVALVGVNATADTTNRLAVASDATLFNHAGAGHQIKLNKATSGATASQLYQTGFSGRAEIGTTGDDDFHFKVSADGTTWREAIVIPAATGIPRLPAVAKASLPSATSGGVGAIVFVPDEAGGAVLAFSDGANWRRVTDRAIVS
ncbi:MAG: DUF2793 domain-containing protein [Hyphomicrobiaceae bacterium]|nr:DUF2793 domain-containing protein [Hyphomicrobiaceae bacterium]